MGIPQIVVIVLHGFSLGIMLEKHGTPKTGKHNAWSTMAAIALTQLIFWWGGWYQ